MNKKQLFLLLITLFSYQVPGVAGPVGSREKEYFDNIELNNIELKKDTDSTMEKRRKYRKKLAQKKPAVPARSYKNQDNRPVTETVIDKDRLEELIKNQEKKAKTKKKLTESFKKLRKSGIVRNKGIVKSRRIKKNTNRKSKRKTKNLSQVKFGLDNDKESMIKVAKDTINTVLQNPHALNIARDFHEIRDRSERLF